MSEGGAATAAGGSRGERRRRRLEAEAARAAGEAELLSRKEIRRRRLEEEARLAAIATGELPLMDEDVSGHGERSNPGEEVAEADGPSLSRRELREQRRREMAAAAPSAQEATPSAASADAAGPSPARAEEPAPSAPSAPRAAPPEGPQELTSTGRRPVVRAPHTASAIRSLDETGALSGIQPVVREAGDPQEYAPEASADPAEWSGTFTPVSAEIPLMSSPPAAQEPEPQPASAPSTHSGSPAAGPAQPTWRAVSSAEPAPSTQPPHRRSMRERMDLPEPPERTAAREPARVVEDVKSARDTEPVNPIVRVVRVLALVLAAILIGVLITLLWLDQRSGADDPQGQSAGTDVTEIALPLPSLST